MIRRVLKLGVFLFLMLGWVLAGLAVHVIRTPSQVLIIPKEHLGFHETFIDARHWTVADIAMHPTVAVRILETQKVESFDYLRDSVHSDITAALRRAAGWSNAVTHRIPVVVTPDGAPVAPAGKSATVG